MSLIGLSSYIHIYVYTYIYIYIRKKSEDFETYETVRGKQYKNARWLIETENCYATHDLAVAIKATTTVRVRFSMLYFFPLANAPKNYKKIKKVRSK